MDNQQFVSNPIPNINNYNSYAPAPSGDARLKTRTAILAIVALIAVGLVVLSAYLFIQYNDAKTDVDGQINAAVAVAVEQKAAQLEEEFAEREKSEYRNFLGPVDYGELSFEYPKTWSLYIASDAANGGDYVAYMNPIEINASETIYALRIFIYNRPFENVASDYDGRVSSGELALSMPEVNGESANVYKGALSGEVNGKVALIKIRDKTVVLQTDSLLFEKDFDKLLTTIKYNL